MNTETFIESLKNYFNLNSDIRDVVFRSCSTEPYKFADNENSFGEKVCLLYSTQFTVFNINFSMKILCFIYSKHGEILKLEIGIHNGLLEKEISSCRNFLQRRRNLNLAFDILIKAAKLYEIRRLICQTVFQKQPYVTVTTGESGALITCHNRDSSIKYLEVCWCISWNTDDCEVSDLIEFFCNYLVLETDCGNKIKEKLGVLVQADLNFHLKLKLWKSLMQDLYSHARTEQSQITPPTQSTDVFEISDSDSDDSVTITNHYSEIKNSKHKGQVNDEILVIE